MLYEVQHKAHYETTKQVFRSTSLHAHGYYDTRPGKRFRHSIWQQRVRGIVRTLLDEHFQRDSVMMKVIDVGCGRGDFSIEVATRYPQLNEVWGIDFSPETLAIASEEAKLLKTVFFKSADILGMPFEDNSFDGALCINVLHHIHADDLKMALRELSRITKRYLILEIKNRRNLYYRHIHSRYMPQVGRLNVFPTSTTEVSTILGNFGFRRTAERGVFGLKWLSPLLVLMYEKEC
jgi:SAM-dependent methyltransferase